MKLDKKYITENSLIQNQKLNSKSCQIEEIDENLFNYSLDVTSIDLSFNQLQKIQPKLFSNLNQLNNLKLNANLIKEIDANTFTRLNYLVELNLEGNEITLIGDKIFASLVNLETLSFSNNHIKEIKSAAFFNLTHLKFLYLNRNRIKTIQPNTFNNLLSLVELELEANELQIIDENAFSGMISLRYLNLNNNQIELIEPGAFANTNLWMIELSYNQLKKIRTNTFDGLKGFEYLYLDNNKIQRINKNKLMRLPGDLLIDLRDNIKLNIPLIFSALFSFEKVDKLKKYDPDQKTDNSQELALARNLSEDYLSNFLLSLYLDKLVLKISKIFSDEADSYSKNLEKVVKREFTILDFLITLEEDSYFLISLYNFVMNEMHHNNVKKNFEFKFKSSCSFEALCERNDFSLFETFFESLINDDKNDDLPRDIIFNKEAFFYNIDYAKCFEIIYNNNNENIAIYFYKLVNYVFNEYKIDNVKLVQHKEFLKFNYLFLKEFLPNIFRDAEWTHFINVVLDFAYKYDKEKKKLDSKSLILDNQYFKKYIRSQFNEKTSSNKFAIFSEKNVYPKSNEESPESSEDLLQKEIISYFYSNNTVSDNILMLISKSKNQSFLSHRNTQQLVDSKWKYIPRQVYYFNLALYVVLLLYYSFYILTTDTDLFVKSKIISYTLIGYFIILELLQLGDSLINKRFTVYATDFKNIIEFLGYPFCLVALSLVDYDLKSAFNSCTVLIIYWIFILKLDKFVIIGPYVNVFGKIIRRSIGLAIIVFILLVAFVISFQNRANYYNYLANKNQTFNPSNLQSQFNASLESNIFTIMSMFVGQVSNSNMGIGNLDKSSLINFLVYGLFIFLMPILFINIFTGISIDEVQKLIQNAKNEILSNKIEYSLKIDSSNVSAYLSGLERWLKKLHDFLKRNKVDIEPDNELNEEDEVKQMILKLYEQQEKLMKEIKSVDLKFKIEFDSFTSNLEKRFEKLEKRQQDK